LWLAEDHIAFGAASRIQDDEDEARENELLRVRAVHFLVAQERPRAQDKDNAQYLEQENDGLRIQAGTKPDYTVHRGCVAGGVSGAGPAHRHHRRHRGARDGGCFASARWTRPPPRKMRSSPWRSRTTTSRSRPRLMRRRAARSTSPSRARSRPARARTPSFGTKNVNLTVYSRAKVKVGPLARIRIDDEVYT